MIENYLDITAVPAPRWLTPRVLRVLRFFRLSDLTEADVGMWREIYGQAHEIGGKCHRISPFELKNPNGPPTLDNITDNEVCLVKEFEETCREVILRRSAYLLPLYVNTYIQRKSETNLNIFS